ncbi:MAG: thioredoxin domain-containing protein [Desulfopila sp.]
MKLHIPLLASALLLTAVTAHSADTVQPTGHDDRIDWRIMAQWPLDTVPVDLVHSLDGKLLFILDNQHQVLVYDNQAKLQGKIPVGEGVSRIDIAPRGEALYLIDSKANNFTSLALSYTYDIDISGSPYKGEANAPVTLVVFTDFECPYCSKLEPLLEQVFAQNKDTIKIVFKNMPLSFHKMADPAARAALAADMQGKFWEYHDRIFRAGTLTPQLLEETAQQIGLDMARFERDRMSPTVQMRIQKDVMDAEKAGVTGTPVVFINGRKLEQRSPQGFQQLIDQEMANTRNR